MKRIRILLGSGDPTHHRDTTTIGALLRSTTSYMDAIGFETVRIQPMCSDILSTHFYSAFHEGCGDLAMRLADRD